MSKLERRVMNNGPSTPCEQMLEQLFSSTPQSLTADAEAHLKECSTCRDLLEQNSPVISRLHRAAASLGQLQPSPVTGPWSTRKTEANEVAAVTSPLRSPSTSGQKGMLTHGAWLATLAASVLLMIAWQNGSPVASMSNEGPLRESTLVWQPVSEGQPSLAGQSYLANLALPASCAPLASSVEAGHSSVGLQDVPHPHVHGLDFECCTRCHQAGKSKRVRQDLSRQLLKTCVVCHTSPHSSPTPAQACKTSRCSDCHIVSDSSDG